MIRTLLLALLLGICPLAGAQPAPAQASAPGPNDACLGCHGNIDAKAASGKSIAVDAARFGGSVHGAMSLPCAGCHVDVAPDKFPHENVKPVQCANCHEKAGKEYSTTIHGMARKTNGRSVAATCSSCHGSHDILKTSDPASRLHHDNIDKTCAACHGNEAMIKQAKLPGGNVASLYQDSIHGQAIVQKSAMKDVVPTCTNCHGSHDMRPRSDPQSRVARANVPDTCGSCHANVKAIWEKSHHGKMRQAHLLQAPGCNDCHSAHSIKKHDVPEWQLTAVKECGTCHSDYLGTYRDTFHGQVTNLGYTRVATCASCHGSHEILHKEDPLSKISAQNRVQTCQQCHPRANVNFAMFDPHANRHRRDRGELLFFTGRFMEILLVGVFVFFGLHTILWFRRSRKLGREGKAGGGGDNEENQ